jgi:hypothetical protein
MSIAFKFSIPACEMASPALPDPNSFPEGLSVKSCTNTELWKEYITVNSNRELTVKNDGDAIQDAQ